MFRDKVDIEVFKSPVVSFSFPHFILARIRSHRSCHTAAAAAARLVSCRNLRSVSVESGDLPPLRVHLLLRRASKLPRTSFPPHIAAAKSARQHCLRVYSLDASLAFHQPQQMEDRGARETDEPRLTDATNEFSSEETSRDVADMRGMFRTDMSPPSSQHGDRHVNPKPGGITSPQEHHKGLVSSAMNPAAAALLVALRSPRCRPALPVSLTFSFLKWMVTGDSNG